MKPKKIVYFQDHEQQPTSKQHISVSKKNVSLSKAIRESSNSKYQKTHLNIQRLSTGEKSGSQKIKVLLVKDGFIFEKKYMIYDIQCILNKRQQKDEKLDLQTSQNDAHQTEFVPRLSQILDENFLFFNLQGSSVGITKNMIRQNFLIEKDNALYMYVKSRDYSLEHVTIYNKKVQFIKMQNLQIDEQDVTIIDPLKLIEQGQFTRQAKIKNYFHKAQNCQKAAKVLNFSWSLQSNPQTEVGHGHQRSSLKRSEPEWALLFNPPQPLQQNPIRQRSQTKLNTSYGEKYSEGRKTHRESQTKINLTDLMKPKQNPTKPKILSKKSLHDSSFSNLSKMGKQNHKKQDAYGLQTSITQSKKPKIMQVVHTEYSSHYDGQL